MTPATEPALSVILISPGRFERIAKTVRLLASQTRARELQLLLVCESPLSFGVSDPLWSPFHSVQMVTAPSLSDTGAARTLALPHVRARIVAFAEDHAFPAPNWADALLAGHNQQPHEGIGPATPGGAASPSIAAVSVEIRNANPRTALSWADLISAFGLWLAPAVPGPQPRLPGHNTSYKLEILLGYGDRLAGLLGAESVFHQDLAARGYVLWLQEGSYTEHLNMSRLLPFLKFKFSAGRLYAGTIAHDRRSSFSRRLLYAASTPLVPLARFWRLIPDLRRAAIPPSVRFAPGFALALATALVLHAVGEATGYLLGPGNAARTYATAEIWRADFLDPADRALAFDSSPA